MGRKESKKEADSPTKEMPNGFTGGKEVKRDDFYPLKAASLKEYLDLLSFGILLETQSLIGLWLAYPFLKAYSSPFV